MLTLRQMLGIYACVITCINDCYTCNSTSHYITLNCNSNCCNYIHCAYEQTLSQTMEQIAVKCKSETCRLVSGSMRCITPDIETGSEILLPWFGINGAGTFSCWAGAKPKLQHIPSQTLQRLSEVTGSYINQFFKHSLLNRLCSCWVVSQIISTKMFPQSPSTNTGKSGKWPLEW